jgi:murein DD-endopeptidase MepM/ murein hydrolase activator NlpD
MKRISLVLFVLILAGLVVGMTLHFSTSKMSLKDFSMNTPQNANRPLALPSQGDVDFRFPSFSVWQTLATPVVQHVEQPMGSRHGAFAYDAQPFWAMNEQRGGNHFGADLNGIGGMNTDLADPVYAAADGLVVYAGNASPGWGNIVVLAHRLMDGTAVQTMYAHLHRIDVALGSLVGRGQAIGSVGSASGVYIAHLHYEVRQGNGVDIGAGYGGNPLNRINPDEFFGKHKIADDALYTSAFAIERSSRQQREATELFNQLNSEENREKLLEILK